MDDGRSFPCSRHARNAKDRVASASPTPLPESRNPPNSSTNPSPSTEHPFTQQSLDQDNEQNLHTCVGSQLETGTA